MPVLSSKTILLRKAGLYTKLGMVSTLKELRLRYGVSREQLAQASGVRLCRVYWMEYGVETPLPDAVKVLRTLSQVAHRQLCVADLRGLRVRLEPKAYMYI